MRGLAAVVLLLALLAAAGLPGCGGGGGDPASRSTARVEQHYAGGERSVEEFGSEAGARTRAALLGAFKGYLEAIGGHDYPAACARLSTAVQESLAQLTNVPSARARCVRALSALLSPQAAAIAREQAKGRVMRVRVDGGRAFVVFHAPGARLYMMTLVREGSAWRESLAIPSVLAPSPAALGR